jgi:glycosyltransferase involved in cell wall biosynthesis
VICCYNQSEFLSNAINSVLRQSYTAVELIVIDDGSIDDTEAVAARFHNVRYLRQGNVGLSRARNAGLLASGGSFISFLDADDRLLPNAVAIGLRKLQDSKDCAFAAGGFRYIDERGRSLYPTTAASTIGGAYSDLLRFNIIQMHGAVLYRREILQAFGGFNERLAASEDYDLYLRLARHHPFVQYNDIIAEYRRHRSNMTGDYGRMLVATISALEAQRPSIVGNLSLEAALDAGLTHYRSAYGRALLRKAIERVKHPREWGIALREIASVLKLAPVAVGSAIRLILAGIRRRVLRQRRE